VLILEIIGGLLILVILVAVHELGHAIVAHRNGVVVEEFGIGFPPRAWGKKLKNGVLFTLNWLPLGGFVKLQGEHDDDNKPGDYGRATFWQKTKILFAGVLMNWLIAAFLLTILALIGLPKILPNQFVVPADVHQVQQPVQITEVEKGYPATKAGMKAGDEILKLNNQKITSADQLVTLTKKLHGQTVPVTYRHAGNDVQTSLTLRNDPSKPVLGAGLGQQESIRATWSAPIVGVGTTIQYTWVTLQGTVGLVYNLISGLVLQLVPAQHKTADANLSSVSGSVAGPVGILGTIFPAAEKAGPIQLVFLTAIISLSLAVMNALPIPALDGGRWFVSWLYRVRRKKLTKEKEEQIQAVGFSVLMALVVIITVGDVVKLF